MNASLGKFVGIPYDELVSAPGTLDGCWGLVRRVYLDLYGIEVSPHSGARTPKEIRASEADLLSVGAKDWIEVATAGDAGLVWSTPPLLCDVLYARIAGYPHVGLVASEDGLQMLHAYARLGNHPEANTSIVVSLTRQAWWRGLISAYRHPARA